jgi:hypothetical protein
VRLTALVTTAAMLLGPVAVRADEIVTTPSGRSVLLKDDGTWTENKPAESEAKPSQEEGSIKQVIQDHCIREWNQDFRMRAYCERTQWEGVTTLKMGRPTDITQTQFDSIRRHCTGEWPRDFRMRAYCERTQFEGVRELQRSRTGGAVGGKI